MSSQVISTSSSTPTAQTLDHGHIERPTNQVLVLLFILTIIEILVGFVGDSIDSGAFVLREGIQIFLLTLLSLTKGSLIALYFMGIRWENRPILVIFVSFLFPAGLAILVSGLPLFG